MDGKTQGCEMTQHLYIVQKFCAIIIKFIFDEIFMNHTHTGTRTHKHTHDNNNNNTNDDHDNNDDEEKETNFYHLSYEYCFCEHCAITSTLQET